MIGEQRRERGRRGVVASACGSIRSWARRTCTHGQYGRRALGLLAAPPAHRDAERGGAERELARDAGLSDARLAHEEHEPSLVGDGPIERAHQATELGLAADEQVARVGRHRQRERRSARVQRVWG